MTKSRSIAESRIFVLNQNREASENCGRRQQHLRQVNYMSAVTSHETRQNKRPITAEQRLAELKKALQRRLNRKPTLIEKASLDRCAALMVRAECATYDSKVSAEDLVRLHNCARRAEADFERLANVPNKRTPTLAEALRRGR